jgi:hypothetical protein
VTFFALGSIVPAKSLTQTPLTLGSLRAEPAVWVILTCVMAYGVAGFVRSRGASRDGARSFRTGIGGFVAAYIAFFIWWRPSEAFIYAAPVQLPIWLLFHAGWVPDQRSRVWRLAVGSACGIVVAASLFLLWELRDPTPEFFQ